MDKEKKYKAIMLDVDGTIVPGADFLPTPRLCKAVQRAREQGIAVSVVTGRTREAFEYVNERLEITLPVVLEGGARLYDPATKRDIWSLPIPEPEMRGIAGDLLSAGAIFSLYVGHVPHRSPAHAALRDSMKQKDPAGYIEAPWRRGAPETVIDSAALAAINLNGVTHVFISTQPSEVDGYRHMLRKYPSVDFSVNRQIWGAAKGRVGFFVTHGEATKQHGVVEWGKLTGIHPHEMAGVGDEEIDYPLLMACGYKVAMGNAVQSLKDIADYVAPTVEEDGAAEAIERILLA